MTSRDFIYWLQGFLEVADPQIISKEQILLIKKNLDLVSTNEINSTTSPEIYNTELDRVHKDIPLLEIEKKIHKDIPLLEIEKNFDEILSKNESNLSDWYNPLNVIPKS